MQLVQLAANLVARFGDGLVSSYEEKRKKQQ